MKRTPLRKIGKIGKRNIEANKILKYIYTDYGITTCELCGSDFALSWHHRHKREWYRKTPKLLSEFNHTILVCIDCHDEVEKSGEKSDEAFEKLRPLKMKKCYGES